MHDIDQNWVYLIGGLVPVEWIKQDKALLLLGCKNIV